MTKIITSEDSDFELDPESLTDSTDISENIKTNRLEAIRDLEALLENSESASNVSNITQQTKEEAKIECVIKFESRLTKNMFVTNVYLSGLNQTVIERNITEIELNGEDQKLIRLFSFYQNNIYKQKRTRFGATRIFLQKKVIRRRKRNVLSKNDVLITKFYVKVNGKRLNLIDLDVYDWKVNEMKYAFDNNRSTIKILLVRSK